MKTTDRRGSERATRPGLLALLGALLLAAATGCGTSDSAAKLTRELLAMPKEEAYARGDALVAKKKWDTGRQYLRFVAENYANDPIGKQAALRLADSYLEEKTPLGYLEAQSRYKDFRSRYPSHPKSDYALFRLAQVSDLQAERPDRDQSNTRLAASSYRELLQNYPGSPYAAEARARYRAMRDLLAEHEYLVARFYQNRRAFSSSKARFDALMAAFPDYSGIANVLYYAGVNERKLGHDDDARALWDRLRRDFPQNKLVRKLPKERPAAAAPAPAI